MNSEQDMHKEVNDKYSLRGRVFHKIREDILSGRYRQHEELRETAIGKELGVSRTPVREALRQLELEGLVNIVPNKGAYVTGITPKDVKDIYMIRARLEGLCARMAAEEITKEQFDRLEEITMLSEFHEQKKNYQQLFELDSQFHEILYTASASKMLDHLLADFHHYVQRVRKFALKGEERAAKSIKEHKQILEAIREKNPGKADELATLHIMNTISNMNHFKIDTILDENGGQV